MRSRSIPFLLLLAGLLVSPSAFGLDEATSDSLAEQTRALFEREAPDNPLAVRVDRGRIERLSQVDDGLYAVPLRLHVPVDSLSLREAGDEAVGELRLALAIQDREGRVESVGDVNLTVRIAREQLAEDGTEYVVTLPIRLAAGKYTLALGVENGLGAATSFVTGSLKVRRQLSFLELQKWYRRPLRKRGGGLTLY